MCQPRGSVQSLYWTLAVKNIERYQLLLKVKSRDLDTLHADGDIAAVSN